MMNTFLGCSDLGELCLHICIHRCKVTGCLNWSQRGCKFTWLIKRIELRPGCTRIPVSWYQAKSSWCCQTVCSMLTLQCICLHCIHTQCLLDTRHSASPWMVWVAESKCCHVDGLKACQVQAQVLVRPLDPERVPTELGQIAAP